MGRGRRKKSTSWKCAKWTRRRANRLCVGDYLARKRDGPPGWLTLWRGWQTVLLLAEGQRLAREAPRCG